MNKILLFSFLLLPVLLFSQPHKIERDTTHAYKTEFYVYPFAFYTPEKKLAFGGGGVYSFRNLKWHFLRPSKIIFSTYYTTAKQYLIYSNAEIYLFRGKILFSGILWFEKLIEKFYGFGSETKEITNPNYKLNDLNLEAKFYYSFTESLLAGVSFNYKNILNFDPLENPYLKQDDILGNKDGLNTGFGILLRYDTRNNVFYPSEGNFIELSSIFYDKFLGGDYRYRDFIFDVRKYLTLSKSKIFAFEAYYDAVNGSPPFYNYPRLGGSYRMRGYYEGRFRDKEFFTVQTELRLHIYKRFFGVLFLGVGDVFNKPSYLRFRNLKVSYGLGLRYRLSEYEKMNIRLDVGFGRGTYGIYFQAEEAF